MKDSYEQRIQNQFGAFCVKVLKNEARHIQREYARLRDQEKSLGELTASELEQTAVWDRHFMDEHVFDVQGLPGCRERQHSGRRLSAAAGRQAGCDPAVLLPGNDGPGDQRKAEHRPSDRIEAAARYTERIARISGEGGI